MREWMSRRREKQAGRMTVKSHQRSNKFDVGAFQSPSASEAAAASPQAADPMAQWDPWACWPCQPSDKHWPADEALGAFGRSGKKGCPKKPLDCWTCQGTGHPSWFCSTVPGTTMGARCGLSKGFRHFVTNCPSEGGGKYVKPEKGKGKGKGKTDMGKGKGCILYNTKGNGKGTSLLGDQSWPGAWPEDPWWAVSGGQARPWMQASPPSPPPGMSMVGWPQTPPQAKPEYYNMGTPSQYGYRGLLSLGRKVSPKADVAQGVIL